MSQEPVQFIVPEEVEDVRADKILASNFPHYSRTVLQDAFDEGRISIDGQPIKKSHQVSSGDCLQMFLPVIKQTELKPVDLPLDIVFEDADIVVLNKAPGQIVHPGIGTGDDTLVHAMLYHTKGNLSMIAGELRPGVVHRLDKETSGLIIFAKTDVAYLSLIKQFSGRLVKKEYLALVDGTPRLLSGTINEPIDRHPKNRLKMTVSRKGKPAHTDWDVEKGFPKQHCALLRCWLHTGRTHQIRVHLSFVGHPIMGDKLYGWKMNECTYQESIPRIMLHANKLSFQHPVSGKELSFVAPLPPDFDGVIRDLTQKEKSFT